MEIFQIFFIYIYNLINDNEESPASGTESQKAPGLSRATTVFCAAWPSSPLLITGSAPGTSGTPAIACWKAGSSFNSVKGLFSSVGSSGYKK